MTTIGARYGTTSPASDHEPPSSSPNLQEIWAHNIYDAALVPLIGTITGADLTYHPHSDCAVQEAKKLRQEISRELTGNSQAEVPLRSGRASLG